MSKDVLIHFWCDDPGCPSHVERTCDFTKDTLDTIPKNWLVDMSRAFHACSRRCARRINELHEEEIGKALLWLTHRETL